MSEVDESVNFTAKDPARRKRKNRPAGASPGHDYRVTFQNGVEIEITNCADQNLARALAVKHMRDTHREAVITKCERLLVDHARHVARMKAGA